MKLAVACVLVTLSFAQTLQAGTRESVDRLRDNWTVPPTAEARQELWINALHQFSQAHPNLPASKMHVIDEAIANIDASFFADNSDLGTKAKLIVTLLTLKDSLSAGQFREILTAFGGLHTWLTENQVAIEGDCNCSGTCANGYSCQSVGCLSPKGTVNYGVCS